MHENGNENEHEDGDEKLNQTVEKIQYKRRAVHIYKVINVYDESIYFRMQLYVGGKLLCEKVHTIMFVLKKTIFPFAVYTKELGCVQ